MRRVVRVLIWLIGAVVLLAGVASIAALWAYRRTWSVPLPAIRAVSDPAVIARGRYIVFGPGRCADCHAPDAERPRLLAGEEVALTGGPGEHTFIGTWSAPNLTSDRETGLGAVSDGQIARMLRYGVDREGRIAPPFMDAYADLAEDDLVAIVSFLRSLAPAPGMPPSAEINFYGKLTLAYFLRPYAPSGPIVEHVEPAASSAYGGYIANTLAGCRTCHTARNLKTGAYPRAVLRGRAAVPVAAASRAGVRQPESHAGRGNRPDRRLDRRGLRAAVPARPRDSGLADAVGQLQADVGDRSPRAVSALREPTACAARQRPRAAARARARGRGLMGDQGVDSSASMSRM